jgi:hypothetical protein
VDGLVTPVVLQQDDRLIGAELSGPWHKPHSVDDLQLETLLEQNCFFTLFTIFPTFFIRTFFVEKLYPSLLLSADIWTFNNIAYSWIIAQNLSKPNVISNPNFKFHQIKLRPAIINQSSKLIKPNIFLFFI